jgi:hypothetical protein
MSCSSGDTRSTANILDDNVMHKEVMSIVGRQVKVILLGLIHRHRRAGRRSV